MNAFTLIKKRPVSSIKPGDWFMRDNKLFMLMKPSKLAPNPAGHGGLRRYRPAINLTTGNTTHIAKDALVRYVPAPKYEERRHAETSP